MLEPWCWLAGEICCPVVGSLLSFCKLILCICCELCELLCLPEISRAGIANPENRTVSHLGTSHFSGLQGGSGRMVVLGQGLGETLGGCCPHLRKLRSPGPVCRAGSRPDSWIVMAKTVSGLFKRAACEIYVREWMQSFWSWRALMNEMGSKILYACY